MHVIGAFIAGLFCCLGVALDAFQTYHFAAAADGSISDYENLLHRDLGAVGGAGRARPQQQGTGADLQCIYGPLSLLLLLLLWALLLISGFAMFYFSMRSPFGDVMMGHSTSAWAQFGTDFYVSGTTLFTLGLGDVVPHSLSARALIIFESGVGLGFVALVIGYLPVLLPASCFRGAR